MKDIPGSANFIKTEPIQAGLSSDQKFRVETGGGQTLLLRISDASEYESRKVVLDRMKLAAAQDVPMCLPVDFGLCCDGKSVYQLLSWCEGKNLEEVLPALPETQQYALGLKAGNILRRIHRVPAPVHLGDWAERYWSVNKDRLNAYRSCDARINESGVIFDYLVRYRHLLKGRPQCLHHGDYHVGNLLLADDAHLSVIDWELLDYDNYGDPFAEFNRIGNSDVHPHFTSGMINGYFEGRPPEEFWRLLAFYLSAGACMLVSWVFYLQKDQLDYSIHHIHEVLRWFDHMKNPVPVWYIPD